MVSNASEDFPEPLKPVITTSLSRGIFSVRFLRLCSRAPPILMNSLLTDPKFWHYTIGKFTRDLCRSKAKKETGPAWKVENSQQAIRNSQWQSAFTNRGVKFPIRQLQ